MIIGQMTTGVLSKMEESKEFRFFLTGSRFFGIDGVNSDHDFFIGLGDKSEYMVKDELSLYRQLTEWGFSPTDAYEYRQLDLITEMVWRHYRENVDVCIIKWNCLFVKMNTQDMMKRHFLKVLNVLPKEDRSHLWNSLYEYEFRVSGESLEQKMSQAPRSSRPTKWPRV